MYVVHLRNGLVIKKFSRLCHHRDIVGGVTVSGKVEFKENASLHMFNYCIIKGGELTEFIGRAILMLPV